MQRGDALRHLVHRAEHHEAAGAPHSGLDVAGTKHAIPLHGILSGDALVVQKLETSMAGLRIRRADAHGEAPAGRGEDHRQQEGPCCGVDRAWSPIVSDVVNRLQRNDLPAIFAYENITNLQAQFDAFAAWFRKGRIDRCKM